MIKNCERCEKDRKCIGYLRWKDPTHCEIRYFCAKCRRAL